MTVEDGAVTLSNFPKSIILEDGISVTVRPLEVDDEAALLSFFRSVPESERYWLREDVSDPEIVRSWVAGLDYDRVLPLIAERDRTIIADATLHRRGYGARHYLGELRLVVSPAYRGRGLGYTLLAELTEIAQASGLDRLEAEIVSGAQTAAVEAIEQLGFVQAAVLQDHLRGPDGVRHDLALFVLPLQDEP